MKHNVLKTLDGLGRPALRLVGVVVLAAIGGAVAFAFWRWAMGSPIPELPGSAILLAFVPQIPQIVDQITRHLQRGQEIAFGQTPYQSSPNPHGGPMAATL